MITDVASPEPGSTKHRLVSAGLRLFAQQGFRATTVGEIEAAAGLQPRRGALYRHFPSKLALLDAALQLHLSSVLSGRDRILSEGGDSDPRAQASQLGRFVLDELDEQRQIVEVFEHEGERLAAQRDQFREQVSDIAYQAMAEALRRWTGHMDGMDEPDGHDLEAHAVLLLGSLINVRRSAWTLGDTPLGVTEQQVLAAWTEQCVSVADALRRHPTTSRG